MTAFIQVEEPGIHFSGWVPCVSRGDFVARRLADKVWDSIGYSDYVVCQPHVFRRYCGKMDKIKAKIVSVACHRE